jgi:heme exporter protein C
MHRLANPARFLRVANALAPWFLAGSVLLGLVGLWQGLVVSPDDYQQGDTVRIMYVHVPGAYMGLAIYLAMAVSSAMYLIWKHPLADVMARAAAPIGAAFTLICLVTGGLWGKPMWGAYWVWDARLTSMLILFFLYLGHMALTSAFDDPNRGARAGAVLALVGVVNLPIIKFSVDWWNTLHQPASVLRFEDGAIAAPTIPGEMLLPLFLMLGSFKLLFLVLTIWRIRGELAQAKLRNLALDVG